MEEMFQNVIIYTLSDPIDGKIKYIGLTKQKLTQRLQRHCRPSDLTNSHKKAWIRKLKKLNLRPTIEELDKFNSYKEALENEKFYIELFRSWGFKLTNMTDGGDVNFLSEKSLNKMRKKVFYFNKNGELIGEIFGVGIASNKLGIKRTTIISSISKKELVGGKFYFSYLKNFSPEVKRNFIYGKIEMFDNIKNENITFNNTKEIKEFFNLDFPIQIKKYLSDKMYKKRYNFKIL